MRIGRLRLLKSGMMLLKKITQVVTIKMHTMLERNMMMKLDPKDNSHLRVQRLVYPRAVWDLKLKKPSKKRADQSGTNQLNPTKWPLRIEWLIVWLMRCLETMPNLEAFTLTNQFKNYWWKKLRDSYLKGVSTRDLLYKLLRKRNLRNLARITVIYHISIRTQLYELRTEGLLDQYINLQMISYNLDKYNWHLSILFKI